MGFLLNVSVMLVALVAVFIVNASARPNPFGKRTLITSGQLPKLGRTCTLKTYWCM